MKTYILLIASTLLFTPILSSGQEIDPTSVCISNLVENPDFKAISGKVALGGPNNQTIEMLTNKSKPQKNERVVISKWFASLKNCLEQGSQFRKENYSEFLQTAQAQSFQNFEMLVEKLYSRKITYGAFANGRATELANYNAKVLQNKRNIETQKNLDMTVKIKPM